MPKETFFRLPDEKRRRIVEESINEFSENSFNDASLTRLVRRLRIAKGSLYQYFDDKLDLYQWLLTAEIPARKRAFMEARPHQGGEEFWQRFEWLVERGMAFLVVHPRLARLSASASDPAADEAIRGLHHSICEESYREMKALLAQGVASKSLPVNTDLDLAAGLVGAILGTGLIEVILRTLGANLHDVLSDDALRGRLDRRLRRKLARRAVGFVKGGLNGT